MLHIYIYINKFDPFGTNSIKNSGLDILYILLLNIYISLIIENISFVPHILNSILFEAK